jgi:hypothetical protein
MNHLDETMHVDGAAYKKELSKGIVPPLLTRSSLARSIISIALFLSSLFIPLPGIGIIALLIDLIALGHFNSPL